MNPDGIEKSPVDDLSNKGVTWQVSPASAAAAMIIFDSISPFSSVSFPVLLLLTYVKTKICMCGICCCYLLFPEHR